MNNFPPFILTVFNQISNKTQQLSSCPSLGLTVIEKTETKFNTFPRQTSTIRGKTVFRRVQYGEAYGVTVQLGKPICGRTGKELVRVRCPKKVKNFD